MRNRFILQVSSLVLSASLLLISGQTYAADAAKGEKLSQTCMGCHGAPGLRNASPVYNVPMIGGQHAEYLILALKAYKDESRSHPTMQAQAASLSDEDMADIAAYFSALAGNSRPGDDSRAVAGKEKAALCAACHGATGDGDLNTYPKLAGQYNSYIEQSLVDYRSGAKQNAIMAGFAATLTLEDIRDLASWFGSQEGALSAPVISIKK